ncbi:MAG: hypothetical protein AAF846_18640, partial [Chloroflexota bacterium]
SNNWHANDYFMALHQMQEIAATCEHEVHVLVDFRDVTTFPKHIMIVISQGMLYRIANLGVVVIMSESFLWKKLYNIFHNLLAQIHIAFAPNEPVALQVIRDYVQLAESRA